MVSAQCNITRFLYFYLPEYCPAPFTLRVGAPRESARKVKGAGVKGLPGGHSEREPPDPIPNSEVKTLSADDSLGSPHAKVGHCQAFYSKTPTMYRRGFAFFIGGLRAPTQPSGDKRGKPGDQGRAVSAPPILRRPAYRLRVILG